MSVVILDRTDGKKEMKIHLKPFIGAHNTIGEDNVTIRISPGGIFVEKFEHLKGYTLPPQLQ